MIERPNLLMGTICNELFFEKSKAPRSKPVEKLVTICIYPLDESRTTKAGALLPDEQKAKFEKFMKKNMNVLA